jgi:molecular chaperone GrpE
MDTNKGNDQADMKVEKQEQGEDFKAKYLRALADYQNYERRVQEQRIELIKGANKQLILKLISFLDDLDRAEAFVSDKNLAHIKDSFFKLLKSEGLEEIEVLDKEYDPYTAEVIDMVKGEKENMVVEVLRKGYMFNGAVLRVAQVRVSKKG